jgi:hypothetical protein
VYIYTNYQTQEEGVTLMVKKGFKSLALALGLSALLVPAVFADDANVTVTGGSLTFSSAPSVADFSGITLDGRTAKTGTAAVSACEVTDARGSGAGWSVTVQASQFAEYTGTDYVAGGKTLAAGSLKLAAPTVAADGTTSNAPVINSGAPWAVDGGSPVKIASAAADTGMGAYDFASSTLTVSVPVEAYAKAYRSDVTITLANTP